MIRYLPLTVAAGVGILAALDAGFAVAEAPAQFIYRVSHSTFGDIGTYTNTVEPNQNGTTVQTKAPKVLTGAEAFTEPVEKDGATYYRARFAGLDKDKAEAACKYLKKNDVECVTIKN